MGEKQNVAAVMGEEAMIVERGEIQIRTQESAWGKRICIAVGLERASTGAEFHELSKPAGFNIWP